MIRYICTLVCFVLCTLHSASAQIDTDSIPAVDSMYLDYIGSVQLYNASDPISMPIIELHKDRLVCRFDDLYGKDLIDYHYTIRHCDKDWKFTPNLEIADYMEGEQYVQIEQFATSVNTIKPYVNYSFAIPNREMRFNWSGNYLLIVYDADGTIAFTKRFFVYENTVGLKATETEPRGVGAFNSDQAFQVEAHIKRLNPLNPTEDLFVCAFQNRFVPNKIHYVTPNFVMNHVAKFNFTDNFQFPGYKEYRFFDMRTLLSGGLHVNHIDISNKHAIVLLDLEKNRSHKPHFSRIEGNGSYVIDNKDNKFGFANIRSEYAEVIFTLKDEFPKQGDVYVMGAFNNFKINPAFKMQYLEEQKAYTLEVPLKQGYYNYFFGFKGPDAAVEYFTFEGSSRETENDYHILSYLRSRTKEYDQLVGYTKYNFISN